MPDGTRASGVRRARPRIVAIRPDPHLNLILT